MMNFGGYLKSTLSQRYGWIRLILINAIVCGTEVCSSSGFSFIPPMLLKARIPETYMTIIVGIGPLLCTFACPYMGRLSDSCNYRIGRRRPFILALSFGAFISLVMVPYSNELAAILTFYHSPLTRTINVVILVVGVILLDFCTQALLVPCEALMSDFYGGSDIIEKAFTSFTLMASAGACIGYFLSSVDWRTMLICLGQQEKCVFKLLIVILVLCLFVTCYFADESPRTPLKSDAHEIITLNSLFFDSPPAIWRLFWCNFLYWSTIMSFNLFYTDYIAQSVYNGRPDSEEGSADRELYDQGVRTGSMGLFLQSFFSCALSPFADRLLKGNGIRKTYLFGIVSFVCATAMIMKCNKYLSVVNFMASLTGGAYMCANTVPFVLISRYHDNKEVFFAGKDSHGVGVNIAKVESAYYLSEIFVSFFMGFLVESLGTVQVYLIISLLLGLVTIYTLLNVVWFDEHDALIATRSSLAASQSTSLLSTNTSSARAMLTARQLSLVERAP